MKAIWTLYSKQIIVAIIAIVVLVILAILVRRGLKNTKDASSMTVQQWQDYVVNPPISTAPGGTVAITPSYPAAQFMSWADQIEEAINGPLTDEEQVFSIHRRFKNDLDFAALQSAFGERYYHHVGGIFGPMENWTSSPISLSGFITKDFDAGEIKELNSILENAAITFRY